MFWKVTAKPMVMENLKSSWKKSWKVIEFEELKRVQSLSSCNILLPILTTAWSETFHLIVK